jgi:hypothetical protein
MPGMNCDGCGHLRLYFKPVVVVRDELARVESERTPPRGEVGVLRFHEPCYPAARAADPALPPLPTDDRAPGR